MDSSAPVQRLPRGAVPSTRAQLAAATPHSADPAIAVPSAFLMWPTAGMSFWGNSQYGDCCSAEEAFAKSCGAPSVLVPDSTVISWAQSHGYLNGANLNDVLVKQQTQGFSVNGVNYFDGPFLSVDWTNDAGLQSAIYLNGPVKIGVGSDDFESAGVTPGTSGWCLHGYPSRQQADHCVSLCGYGALSDLVALFAQNGVNVKPSSAMPTGLCYALFTWKSIGIIDVQSKNAMTSEAWVRDPVTVLK